MMNWSKLLTILLLMVLLTVAIQAQTDEGATATPTTEVTATEEAEVDPEKCPTLVQDALTLTQDRCEQIGDNQVCYGHSTLEAAARAGVPEFNFDEPGDIEDVIEIGSLSLSPMDTLREQWGIILMNVQAEVAALTQGNVTFVIFGNTEVTAPGALIEVTLAQNANLRAVPDGDLVGVAAEGDTLTASGRTEDDAWVFVRFINDAGGVAFAWVSTSLITTDGDLSELEVIDPISVGTDSPFQYGPMQAFYFESGIDDAPCDSAPSSGMLIQTPEGQASVTLFIDEVIIELDGTAYVQAERDGDLSIRSIDGNGVTVTADGETHTAIPGTEINVPLDANLGVIGAPDDPVPYDAEDVQSLPTELLAEPVDVADPLDVVEGSPAPGRWLWSWDTPEQTCPDGSIWTFESSGVPNALIVTDGGATVAFGDGVFNQQSTGVYTRAYVDDNSNLYQETLTVLSLDLIAGQSVIDLASTPCTLTVPFTLRLVGAS